MRLAYRELGEGRPLILIHGYLHQPDHGYPRPSLQAENRESRADRVIAAARPMSRAVYSPRSTAEWVSVIGHRAPIDAILLINRPITAATADFRVLRMLREHDEKTAAVPANG